MTIMPTTPATCPAWCAEHDVADDGAVMHSGVVRAVQGTSEPRWNPEIRVEIERLDRPGRTGQPGVRIGGDLLTPTEALELAGIIRSLAVAALLGDLESCDIEATLNEVAADLVKTTDHSERVAYAAVLAEVDGPNTISRVEQAKRLKLRSI